MQFTAGRKLRASELNYHTETGVDCHYRASANQTLNNLAVTPIAFGTAVRTTPLVTRATHAAGHKFTVSRAGVWSVNAVCRVAAGGTAGSRFIGVANVASGVIYAEAGLVVSNTGVLSLALPLNLYLAASDAIYVSFYTDGSAVTAESGLDRVSFRMAWLHD